MELARLLLYGHIAAGTAALVLGLWPMFSAKGSRRHRRAGRLFVWAMAGVVGTAVAMICLRFTPYFAALTTLAGYITFSGVRVLVRRRRADAGATPLDWTVALVALGAGGSLVVLTLLGQVTRNVAVMYATGGGAAANALYDLYRFCWPALPPRSPHLYLYEHQFRMFGAYFGAMAAFSGSVLGFLPPPWRQLWAVALGNVVAVGGMVLTARRLRRGRAP